MTSVRNVENYPWSDEYSRKEDIQFFPRCSTPIFGFRNYYFTDDNQGIKNREYRDWKRRLEREKFRKFKLRGPGKFFQSCGTTNCTMISGYFEATSTNRICDKTIVRPTSVHRHTCLPISNYYSSSWNPGINNYQHSHHFHHHPPSTPINYQPTPFFGAPAGDAAVFFNIFGNAHHHHHYHYTNSHQNCYAAKPQVMHCNAHCPVPVEPAPPQITIENLFDQYDRPTPFLPHFPELKKNTNHVNIPLHDGNVFPVMMSPP